MSPRREEDNSNKIKKHYDTSSTGDPYKDLAYAMVTQAAEVYYQYLKYGKPYKSHQRLHTGQTGEEEIVRINYNFLNSDLPYFFVGIEGKVLIKGIEDRVKREEEESLKDKYMKYKEGKKYEQNKRIQKRKQTDSK